MALIRKHSRRQCGTPPNKNKRARAGHKACQSKHSSSNNGDGLGVLDDNHDRAMTSCFQLREGAWFTARQSKLPSMKGPCVTTKRPRAEFVEIHQNRESPRHIPLSQVANKVGRRRHGADTKASAQAASKKVSCFKAKLV